MQVDSLPAEPATREARIITLSYPKGKLTPLLFLSLPSRGKSSELSRLSCSIRKNIFSADHGSGAALNSMDTIARKILKSLLYMPELI